MAKGAVKSAPAGVERRPALAGREATGKSVKVEPLGPAERVSLRASAESVASLSRALGLTLPQKPKTSAAKGSRIALWLGPDEWLVFDEEGKDLLGDCAKAKQLHSAVGISHRNVAISVSGPAAEACVNAGCPQDLSLAAFPVGACSRTVLGKAEIILYRPAEDAFRVECWRSFSDYVFTFLSEAARDAAA
ncbi:sarcosine oxidase subunit gamma [Ollibium composti]|uniref:Sarcosine oxidase subunit gamma family protein n=1 Tax=Ollibium composti TaxID=2675109 RepID=A0ABY2Q8A4_9HYPH|nr:sarcosine oxidase subunit gamma [Mesorhizobium composti]THF57966.1 sarcosine oxidase subunit gamma family protein [Mesorhizobium composti]